MGFEADVRRDEISTGGIGSRHEPYYTIYRLDRFQWEWTVYTPNTDGWSLREHASGSDPAKFIARRRARRALRTLAVRRREERQPPA
jgi:hypothetical protein